MPETILIVDYDPAQLSITEQAIRERLNFQAVRMSGAMETLHYIISGRPPQPDLVLFDLATPGALQVISDIKAQRPQLPIIVLTSYGEDEQVAHAMSAGASDFLTKPVTLERLKFSIHQVLKLQHLTNAMHRLERRISHHIQFSDMIGRSMAFRNMLNHAMQAATSKSPLWIEGASGAGKEFLARTIHGSSDRAGKPFVVVDCDRLTHEATETILFGGEKQGSKLREAEHGTLFFKDIDALTPSVHHRLLETLEKNPAADIRVMCSTCKSVEPLVAHGRFNPVLFRYLKTLSITVPSLSDRREDVGLLAKHFVVQHAITEGKNIYGLTEQALQLLTNHNWPGNMRQLSHLLLRAVILCNQDILDAGDIRLIQQLEPGHYADNHAAFTPHVAPMLLDTNGHVKKLKSIEEEVIRFALRHANGCMTRAARNLGIGRSTLYRRVNELQIDHISRANHTTRPMMKVSSAERS